jgi:hypothetical protein
MRGKRILVTAAVVALAVAATAWAVDEVWKSKPYAQWDAKDVEAVMRTSPWAKVNIQAAGSWKPPDTTPMTGGSPGVAGSSSDTSHINGARADQTGGAADAGGVPLTFSVFWWSSRTVREANFRSQVLKGTAKEAQAESALAQIPEDYQILVAGRDMSIFAARGEDAFKNAASLKLHKSKAKLTPVKVEFQKGPDGKIVDAIFSFEKKTASGEPTISSDEKDVDFNLQLGDAWLRTTFNPKQMVDGQGEDL